MEKTQVVWIGSKKNCTEKFCEDYDLIWNNSNFKLLGIISLKELDQIVEINYREKIEDIKDFFVNWTKRNIIMPLGRVTVIKKPSSIENKSFHFIITQPI